MKTFTWAIAGLFLFSAATDAANWPSWRGPRADGSADAVDLPAEWDIGSGKNVIWKLPLPGRSAATPCVWDNLVFIVSPGGSPTTPPAADSKSKKKAAFAEDLVEIFLICVDLTSGKELWRRKLGGGNRRLGFNSKNNFCTPSASTDGKHVWALTGGLNGEGGELVCFTVEGKEIWRRNLQKDHGKWTHLFGLTASPLLFSGALYLPVIQEKGESFVLAIDAGSGKDLWKTPRVTHAEAESKDAYSSCIALAYPDRAEIVLCAADLVTAYDPKTGKETWRSDGVNEKRNTTLRIICSPIAVAGVVYAFTAKSGPLLAIRGGSTGDVTKTGRAWTRDRDMPDLASPSHADGLIYALRENGVVTCMAAADGKEQWSQRVASDGVWSPSPLIADGKVYVINENGMCVVLAAGKDYKLLATNRMNEFTLASPVAVGNRLLIRTDRGLYCIGKK